MDFLSYSPDFEDFILKQTYWADVEVRHGASFIDELDQTLASFHVPGDRQSSASSRGLHQSWR
ncbi:hypothetical protein Dimus_005607, partial [Dionaea muscipula]